jgi:hypothetical protein
MITRHSRVVGVTIAFLVTWATAVVADDWNEATKVLDIIDRWSNYATHGQQFDADTVVNSLIDARQQRVFITIIDERVRDARVRVAADLAAERRWDYDRSSGGPDVVVGPDMAELRRLQKIKLRNLERTIAAYDAVLACMDPDDDHCLEVRDIDRQRAQWRQSGDPLLPGPDVPGSDDLRDMLEDAFQRHQLTLDRHRRDLERLQRVTNRMAGAHIIVEDRVDELGDIRRSVQKITTELRQRRTRCEDLCADAKGYQAIAGDLETFSGADAVTARKKAERTIDDARALAAACASAADADRIEALVREAEGVMGPVDLDLDLARQANANVVQTLKEFDSARDTTDLKARLDALHPESMEAGGVIIDQLVEIEGAFEDVVGLRRRVADLAEDLKSLDALDDEIRSWERALAEDSTAQKLMHQQYGEFRREYELVRTQAEGAVDWADEITALVGGPDLLEADYVDAGNDLGAAEQAARDVTMPDCDAVEADITTLASEHALIVDLLRAASGLRAAAAACRGRTGTVPPPSATGPSSGSGATASSVSPTPSPIATPAAVPTPSVYGGLVIVGLPQPARITVGSVVQLEGRDHGGRRYSGVEWVSSNEQVLLADPSGRIVAQQAGEAMVLAKFDGMRAWLDVEVVDPGGTPPASPPSGPTGGSASSGGSSGTGTSPTTGGGAVPPPGNTRTGAGAANEFDFGDGGSGTVESEPVLDDLLGVSPPRDAEAPSPAEPSEPPTLGLLGHSPSPAGTVSEDDPFGMGEMPDIEGSLFDPAYEPAAGTEPAPSIGSPQPAGPTQDDIVQMLQQTDCTWLPGSVPAYDQGSGQLGCTCPPGTELATDRPACLDCQGPQVAFMQAVEAQNYQMAQQAIQAASGCGWAPYAQGQLRDFVCTEAEIRVLEALNAGGPIAAQGAIQQANAQGCAVSPQTLELVRMEAQPLPGHGSPPTSNGPDADEMMQMLGAVTQSLIAMQGGDPGSIPSPGPSGTSTPMPAPGGGGGSAGSANPGESPEQCARRLCERECANAIGLLTEGTTAACDQCLKRRKAQCTGGGGSTASPQSPGSDSAFSSGSGAWAVQEWTMPTGEGGGRCYAGKSYTRPYRYAIACDGNDGSAIFKLSFGGHPALVYGPGSFTDCQRYLAQLTGGQ